MGNNNASLPESQQHSPATGGQGRTRSRSFLAGLPRGYGNTYVGTAIYMAVLHISFIVSFVCVSVLKHSSSLSGYLGHRMDGNPIFGVSELRCMF